MAAKTAPRPTVHRARIPADALTVLVVQTLVLAGIWVCAVVVSFTGLIAAAGWANVAPGQRVFVPLFIDGVLIGGSLAYLVAKERKDAASRAIAATAMATFALLSVLGNAVHALAAATSGLQRTVGVLVAVAAPVAILVTTELLARTVIASPDEHVPAAGSRAARRASRIQPQTTPAIQALTSPSGPAPTTTPAPVLPASVRTGASTGRSSGGASVQERLEAVRALDVERPGLSERMAAAALCEAHGDPGWISRTTVARMRRRIAEENEVGARGLAAVG